MISNKQEQRRRELYDLLFAPVHELIHTNALLIAPHDVLHYLPFGALHDGEGYLVEQYAVAYLPSASLLQYVLGNVPDSPTGDLLALKSNNMHVYAYLRDGEGEDILVVHNLGSETVTDYGLSLRASEMGAAKLQPRDLLGDAKAATLEIDENGRFFGYAPLPDLEPLQSYIFLLR